MDPAEGDQTACLHMAKYSVLSYTPGHLSALRAILCRYLDLPTCSAWGFGMTLSERRYVCFYLVLRVNACVCEYRTADCNHLNAHTCIMMGFWARTRVSPTTSLRFFRQSALAHPCHVNVAHHGTKAHGGASSVIKKRGEGRRGR